MKELHRRVTYTISDLDIVVSPAFVEMRPARGPVSIEGHVFPCLSTLLDLNAKPAISYLMVETIGTGVRDGLITSALNFPVEPSAKQWAEMRLAAAHIAAYFTDILVRQSVYGSKSRWRRHIQTLLACWHQADTRLLEDGQTITVQSGLGRCNEITVVRESGRRMPIHLEPFGIHIEGAAFRTYEVLCADYSREGPEVHTEERSEPQLLLEYAHGVHTRALAL